MTIDDISYIDIETINGLNLYAYCGNNPVMRVDENGNFWKWLISGLQILAGIVLVATGVGVGLGASLIIGGSIGIIGSIAGNQIGIGLGSLANGWGAISTGLSLFSYGWIGAIIGATMIAIGVGTMAFGANDIVSGVTGPNYIQQWTGMSDSLYGWLNFGLNAASSLGTIVGRLGMRAISSMSASRAELNYKPYGKITTDKNIYYYDGKGNPYWSIHNYNLSNTGSPSGFHWHTSLGRDGRHIYNYFEFLFKIIWRK